MTDQKRLTDEQVQAIAAAVAEELKKVAEELRQASAPSDLDWSAIEVPQRAEHKYRPQSGKLSARALAQLEVIANLRYSGSLGSVLLTAAYKYLASCWPGHLADLKVLAAREGITPEEAFERLLKGELSP